MMKMKMLEKQQEISLDQQKDCVEQTTIPIPSLLGVLSSLVAGDDPLLIFVVCVVFVLSKNLKRLNTGEGIVKQGEGDNEDKASGS